MRFLNTIARCGGVEVAGWTVDRKIRVRFPAFPRRLYAVWWQGGYRRLRASQCPCRGRLGTLKTSSCPWRWLPDSRLGYCFTPYQRLWLYNGAPFVAFYDTLGIRRTYSRLNGAGKNLENGQLSRHYIAEISLNVTLNHNQLKASAHSFKQFT